MIDKYKTLLGHAIIYGMGRYLAVFSGMFLVPIYTRIFSPEDYGVIEIITTTISIVVICATLGIDSALNFYFYDTKDEKNRKIMASTSFIFRLFIACLLSAVLAITAELFSQKILKSSEKAIYFIIAILSLPMTQMLSLGLNMLRIRLKPMIFSVVSLGSTVFNIVLSIYLVVYLKIGLYGVFGANLITGLIFGMIVIWLNREYVAFSQFSLFKLKKMLVYGLPWVPLSINIWVIGFLDRFFLTKYSSLIEVGLYSVGYKFSMILSLITASFQMAWVPFAYSIKDDPEAKTMYCKVFTYYVVITTTIALILSLFSKEIIMVFTTHDYMESYKVVGLLVYSIIFAGLYYVFIIGVNLAKKTIHISWTTGVAACLSISINFLLVPKYGMMGAATSSIIAQAVSAYLLFRISQKYYPIAYEIRKGICMFIISALLIFVGISYGNLLVKIIILLSYPILLFAIKAIGKTEVRAFKNLFLSMKVLRA